MALNTIADLSTTAGSNVDVLGQNASGSGSANTIDTLLQNLMALMARAYGDVGGLGTVGGSANAITLTSLSTYQALESGLTLSFKAASANTGATTLNLDGLGAKAVRRQGDSALSANDIIANGRYLVQYDAAYNGAAGAWVLLNSSLAALANGGTGASLSDPNADRLLFWDDSAGEMTWLTPGTGLSISGTTIDATTLTLGTAQSPSAVSSVDFTGIPSTAKQIDITLSAISGSATATFSVQIGDSGGVETSGYTGLVAQVNSTPNVNLTTFSTSFQITGSRADTASTTGIVRLRLQDASTNTWVEDGNMSDSANFIVSSGVKSLSATLDRVRLLVSTGTFDAGKINIQYQ